MQEPVQRPATYDDLIAVPEHLVAEIVGGELYTSPRPSPRHATAASALGSELNGAFQRARGGPGGWWILDEPELHLGRDVMVPDIAGWRRERMPSLPETAWFDVAPDWICEVVSPHTADLDRIRKLPRYARCGVPHAWIIDPAARAVEVYKLKDEHWLIIATHGGEEKVRLEPFDAIEIDLSWLWPAQGA